MNLQQVIQDTNYSHRTQISFSQTMYKQVMKKKGSKSLAAYIRDMLLKVWRIEAEKDQNVDRVRKMLAKPMKKNPPSLQKVMKWQKKVREDRELGL